MLIERVRLKGFLSHFGQSDDAPVEVDFTGRPLWLVHGPNGSGKSALVFDAIAFALYKKHRGSDTKTTFAHLIHQDRARAEVEVELLIGGEHFRVRRVIHRTKTGASVTGLVERHEKGTWRIVPDTEGDVEGWTARTLRMSAETFLSTVLLQQGRADRFLNAAPKDRRRLLMELIDMQFYEKLGERATARRNDWRRDRDKARQALQDAPPTTLEKVEQARAEEAAAQAALDEARKVELLRFSALKEARRAAKLEADIRERETRRREYESTLAREAEIERVVERYHDLNAALPRLEAVHEARRMFQTSREEVTRLQNDLSISEADRDEAARALANAEAEAARTREALHAAQSTLGEAEEALRQARDQVRQLDEIERLETRAREVQDKLERLRPILEREHEIEAAFSRREALAQALPRLDRLRRATSEHTHAHTAFIGAETELARAREENQRALHHLETYRAARDEAQEKARRIETTLREQESHLKTLRERLEHRHSLEGIPECPICGSTLTTEEARARLERERSTWEQEAALIEATCDDLRQRLATAQTATETRQADYDAAQHAVQQSDRTLAAAEATERNAEEAVLRAREAHDAAYREAGSCVDELDQYDALNNEFNQLANVIASRDALLQARRDEQHGQDELARLHQELAEKPHWSEAERASIRQGLAHAEDAVEEQTRALDTAQTAASDASKQREARADAHGRADERVGQVHRQLADAIKRAQESQRFLQDQEAEAALWATRPAFSDNRALEALHDERRSLQDAPALAEKLKDARLKDREVKAQIDTLLAQLEAIPEAHRRPVSEIEAEHAEAENRAEEQEKAARAAAERRQKRDEEQRHYAEREAALSEAEREHERFDKLARIFGKTELQARVMQAAQALIQQHANLTLSRLSRGTWQLELDGDGDELRIHARDLSQGHAREFEYLSGGERFRVAVSLAVAIGQSVSGGRTTDTLIIDEGFGALDERGRILMVDELRRLSTEVFSNGRVIIVSHQDDVRDHFPDRYYVTKNDRGRAIVQHGLLA